MAIQVTIQDYAKAINSLSGNWERARFFSLFAHQLATKITYLEMPR